MSEMELVLIITSNGWQPASAHFIRGHFGVTEAFVADRWLAPLAVTYLPTGRLMGRVRTVAEGEAFIATLLADPRAEWGFIDRETAGGPDNKARCQALLVDARRAVAEVEQP